MVFIGASDDEMENWKSMVGELKPLLMYVSSQAFSQSQPSTNGFLSTRNHTNLSELSAIIV